MGLRLSYKYNNPCPAELFVLFFIHLKLELLVMQFPAPKDETFKKKIDLQ